MTIEEIKTASAALSAAYEASITANNAYRTAKAEKFLELSFPKDGSKKPAEAIILAMIDADATITALRLAAARADAELDVKKMTYKANMTVKD